MLLEEMGIIQRYDFKELLNRIEKSFGEQTSSQIKDAIYARGDRGDSEINMYDIINSNAELSLMFVGGFDGGYYKKSLEAILKKGQYLGDTVLDIGCNNGLLTCCLAKLFPEKHFCGIDIVEKGIEVAKELKARYRLDNIEFRVSKAADEIGSFDTVFMSKIAHELIALDSDDIDWTQDRNGLVDYFKKESLATANIISNKLNENGFLIAVERFPYDIWSYGYVKALAEAGLYTIDDEYDKISFTTLGEREQMPLIIASKQVINQDAVNLRFESILDELDRQFYSR